MYVEDRVYQESEANHSEVADDVPAISYLLNETMQIHGIPFVRPSQENLMGLPPSPTKVPNQSSGSNSSCLWPESESPTSPLSATAHPPPAVYFNPPTRMATNFCYTSHAQFHSLGIYGTSGAGDWCLSPTLREPTTSDSLQSELESAESRERPHEPNLHLLSHAGAWTTLPPVWPYRFTEDDRSGGDAFRLGSDDDGGYQAALLEAPRPNYSLLLCHQQREEQYDVMQQLHIGQPSEMPMQHSIQRPIGYPYVPVTSALLPPYTPSSELTPVTMIEEVEPNSRHHQAAEILTTRSPSGQLDTTTTATTREGLLYNQATLLASYREQPHCHQQQHSHTPPSLHVYETQHTRRGRIESHHQEQQGDMRLGQCGPPNPICGLSVVPVSPDCASLTEKSESGLEFGFYPSNSSESGQAFSGGSAFVQIWSSVNKTGPRGSALDELIDLSMAALLREGVLLRLDHPICLIERPLLQVSNVIIEGLHRIYRECPTQISSEVLMSRGKIIRNNFVDVCFRLDELAIIGQFSTGFYIISPQLVKARLLPTSIHLKLQILPQASAKTEDNDRNARQLLQLSDLRVDRWSGLRFESADVEASYVRNFLFKLLELVTRISSIPTRLAFQRSLRNSMQQLLINLTFADPFFYPNP